MLPKFNKTSAPPQFQTLDDAPSKDSSRSDFADDSMSISASENRDDSSCDIVSGEIAQLSVASVVAEAREAIGKEIVHPGSPVDCFGFPETEALANNSPPTANSAGAQPSQEDTAAPETVKIRSTSEEFRNRQWSSLPPPPPPPPLSQMKKLLSLPPPPPPPLPKINTSVPAMQKNDTEAENAKDAILSLAKHVAMSQGIQPTEWTDTSLPPPALSKHSDPSSTLPPTIAKSLENTFEQPALSETEVMTSFENTFNSQVGASSETSFNNKDDASFFVESVGNVTMDAFGFPLVEPVTPAKSIGTKSNPVTPAKSVNNKSFNSKSTPKTPATNTSMRAVPACAHDSPAKAMFRIKSAPALNRLIANAQMQAHYKGATALQFQQDFSIPDALPNETGSTALPEANEEPQQIIDKAKGPVMGDHVDMSLVCSLEDPNKSCQDKDAVLSMTSGDLTNPTTNISAFTPNFFRHESTSMNFEGSFDANESSIAHLDSSVEVTMKIPHRRTNRLPSSKLGCTDDNVYCNINLKELEKSLWEFLDDFDERTGTCGYVVGCTDRIPKVVNTSVNDTFSLLEDEFVNKAAEHSVSLLDSLTIDEQVSVTPTSASF